MSKVPNCPKCESEHTYRDREFFVCPMCSYEWQPSIEEEAAENKPQENIIKDSNGNLLQDGDTVIVIKDLKVGGGSSVIKSGTKVKGIRLIYDSADGHDIDCKIKGFGGMKLKSEFVKKAK